MKCDRKVGLLCSNRKYEADLDVDYDKFSHSIRARIVFGAVVLPFVQMVSLSVV